jgi:iron complex outermembrane receptor protein
MLRTLSDLKNDLKIIKPINISKSMKKSTKLRYLLTRYLKPNLKMKITAFLIMVSLFNIHANTYSQNTKISINLEKVTVEKVIKEIETKTEFKFLVDTQQVNLNRIVSVNENNNKISRILIKLFNGTNVSHTFLNKQIILKVIPSKINIPTAKKLTPKAIQNTEIKGVVTDDGGSPLPGVGIVIVGTTIGTETDFDGNYTINASKGDVLEFSFIGMTSSTAAVGDSNTINISLVESSDALDEVVVTALGIKKETRAVGFAVSEINGEELQRATVVNPVNSLQGKTAGVQISTTSGGTFGGSRITIRGNATFDPNTQPIFVVDGVVIENDISGTSGSDWGNQLKNLNPDDFETFSILKGAAASALYGSRAINGVVMVTTKKGSKQQGLGVTFSQSVGTRYISDSADFQNEYGSGNTAGWFSFVGNGPNTRVRDDKHDTSQFFAYDLATGLPSVAFNSWEEHAASWGPRFDGQEIIDYDGSRATWSAQPDNYKDFHDTGFLTNTNVAISGGGETNSFRMSITNFAETGVVPNNDFDKKSLSLNGSQDLIKNKLVASSTIHYTKSDASGAVSPGANSHWFHDGFPRNYDVNKWRNNYKDVDGGIPYPAGGNYNYTRMSKIWMDALDDTNDREETSLIAKIDLDYTITDNLNVKLEGNFNQYNTMTENKNVANSANRLNGSYEISHTTKFQSSFSAKVFYNKQINKDFRFDAVLGGEMWRGENSFSSVGTSGGFKVRDLYSISNSRNASSGNGGINFTKQLNSVYGFVNLDYKRDLYLALTFRNDWSSALAYPNGGGDWSYPYYSASLAWVASETFELPQAISFLKFRGSYALVGNDTGIWQLQPGFVPDNFGAQPSLDMFKYQNNTSISPAIESEQKYSFETGFDIRLFESRVKIDVAYYKDNNKGQVIDLAVPYESGISSQRVNSGNLQNQGIEGQIDVDIIRSVDWSWSFGVNATHNEDKLRSLFPGITEYQLDGNPDDSNAGTATYAYVGGSYGDLVTRRGYAFYDGTNTQNQGTPILWNRNGWSVAYMPGIANKSVLHKMGNMQADWYGGANTSIRYKNFNLSALVDARFGGEIYSADLRYGMHQGVIQSSVANRDAQTGGITWTSDGQGQNFYGKEYQDGYIPNGIFPDGTQVTSGPSDNRVQTDVGGLSYQQAYDQGLVEPTHYSGFVYRHTSASTGTPITGIFTQEWIALREVSLSYDVPSSFLDKTFINSADLSLTGRDLGYLHNSAPDNINPTISSNAAGNARQMRSAPYVSSVTFAVKLNF